MAYWDETLELQLQERYARLCQAQRNSDGSEVIDLLTEQCRILFNQKSRWLRTRHLSDPKELRKIEQCITNITRNRDRTRSALDSGREFTEVMKTIADILDYPSDLRSFSTIFFRKRIEDSWQQAQVELTRLTPLFCSYCSSAYFLKQVGITPAELALRRSFWGWLEQANKLFKQSYSHDLAKELKVLRQKALSIRDQVVSDFPRLESWLAEQDSALESLKQEREHFLLTAPWE